MYTLRSNLTRTALLLGCTCLLSLLPATTQAADLHTNEEYRLISGEVTPEDYNPGTFNLKIAKKFFPPDITIEVLVPIEEPKETLEDLMGLDPEKPLVPEKVPAVDAATGEMVEPNAPGTTDDKDKGKKEPPKPKFKKVKKIVPAPSPFRHLQPADFTAFTQKSSGYKYALPLPKAYKYDPLDKLPLDGPMLLRSASTSLFMAVSVDDPNDSYHYRNTKSMVDFPGAAPIFSEYRRTVENKDIDCTYLKTLVSGVYCYVLKGDLVQGAKVYRLLYVFPETRLNDFLPYSLYSIENFRTNN